jgi:hypothetical protein
MAITPRHIPKKFFSSDENLVFESRPSAWSCMKAAAFWLVVAVLVLTLSYWTWISGAPKIPYLSDWLSDPDSGDLMQTSMQLFAYIVILLVLWRWWIWGNTVYAITDERVIKQTRRWLAKRYRSIPVTQIEDVQLVHPFWGRILRYGTLEISTGPPEGGKADMVWPAIPNPVRVSRMLEEVMDIRNKPIRDKAKLRAAR